MNLLAVENLHKRFNLEAGFFARFGRFVYAINGLSFSIEENETYGLVGESGCGKTTAARLLVGMYPYDEGSIIYRGAVDVGKLKGRSLRDYREKVKYVFQDPARSLNPRMTIAEILLSGYRGSSFWPGERKARAEAAEILEEVGLGATDLERRPGEFSGGQRQRISIARGLLMRPELLICDEVVSALDVSIQGQILNLLLDLKARRNLSLLFIAHDLKISSYFCDRIGVMYRGELLEEAPAMDLYREARHPYTKLLFASVPGQVTKAADRETSNPVIAPKDAGILNKNWTLRGEAATTLAALSGCSFADRCPLSEERCREERPEPQDIRQGHFARCFKVSPAREVSRTSEER